MWKEEESRVEGVLLTLRKTRKAFIIEYACGALLLLMLLVLTIKSVTLPKGANFLVVTLALLAVAAAEFSRVFTCYKITPEKITIIHGIIKQNVKNVHFIPLGFIPEINLKQNRIQRLFNFGTIFIHGSSENSFEIKDIAEPQKVLGLIEELIDKNRIRNR